MQTLSKFKWVIIGVVAIILVFVVFTIFKKDKPEGANGVVKTVVSVPGSDNPLDNKDPAAEFAHQLLAIQTINFNIDFFKDPVYLELVDQSRPLEPRDVGRPNPFLDIGKDGIVFPGDEALVNGEEAEFVQTPVTPAATTTPAKTNPATTTPKAATSTPRR